MAPESRGSEKIARLMERGAYVPNAASVDIGDEVDLANLSGDIAIYPGCRIYGARTAVSAGARLGAEAPVTIEDCRLGPNVELKGGYFKQSVFLAGSNVGSAAQVREGCLLEEEAGGAHCVGLKQTILFPFVTLGSLINFCDCLMAGGTSRQDHSEVGSSYIHFNYTPDGDKTTASLFGDVPRGVMLDQPPIFLGGQGGAVGPVRVGFGTVVTAGSVLRRDVLEDGKLVAVAAPQRDLVLDRRPHVYAGLGRTVRNNLFYLANLVALEQWYEKARKPFFMKEELGPLVYAGALEVLAGAKQERVRRLLDLAAKVPETGQAGIEWRAGVDRVCSLFVAAPRVAAAAGEVFATEFSASTGGAASYIDAIRSLPRDAAGRGVHWLQQIVDALMAEAAAVLPALEL
jgi:bifunctional UDP-N-acetylglucosamine pyrophosphorylase / glucosamine-1-phosphate N-acetyltransferase